MRIISARHKSTPNIFVPKHAGNDVYVTYNLIKWYNLSNDVYVTYNLIKWYNLMMFMLHIT